MRKSVTIMLITILLLMSFKTSDYCDGFKEGYVAGYCYEVDGCNTPNIPNCPNAKAGFTSYQDGYNTGFSKGKEDK